MVVHGADVHNRIMTNDQLLGRKGTKKLQDYQIGKSVLRECGEFDIDLFKTYGMRPTDILPGVICPECGLRGMERMFNGWFCGRCKCQSKDTHLKDIADCLLVVNGFITNTECMWFLGLPNRGTATRILKKSGLTYDNRHRCWYKE